MVKVSLIEELFRETERKLTGLDRITRVSDVVVTRVLSDRSEGDDTEEAA